MAESRHLYLSISSPRGRFFVWTQWNEDDDGGFSCTLFSNIKAWRANVSRDRLLQLAETAEFDEPGEYINLTKRAFEGGSDGAVSFTYDVTTAGGEEDQMKLIWKKRISEKAQFQLGSITLQAISDQKTTGEAFDSFFDTCFKQFSTLSGRMRTLEEVNTRLSDEHERGLQRLTEATRSKERVEQQFLEAFRDVLNAKKRKIVELTEEIDRLQQQLASGGSNNGQEAAAEATVVVVETIAANSTAGKAATKRRVRCESGDEDDDDDAETDTDEENERIEQERREKSRKGLDIAELPLIMTHKDEVAGTSGGEQNSGAATAAEDRLFVPRRQMKTQGPTKSTTQPNKSSAAEKTTKRSTAAEATHSSDTTRYQTRTQNSQRGGPNDNTMDLISKLA